MPLSHKRRVLPGFRLTLGFTLFYLGLIVLIPLAATFAKTATLSWPQFWHAVASPVTLAAYRLSFGASFFAALVNAVFGLLVAWVLVRYQFWGKRVMDGLVDLPFALPTAVAGITLANLYAPDGWIGRWLTPWGITVSYTQLGVFVALTFIGLPFVVRTLQPVLQDFDLDVEEAAASLGANRLKTFFRVILPMILPALSTGFALAFARALGEYGSVVFISSNIPFRTQIVPVLIMNKLDQFDYAGATALAVVMLAISFLLLLGINFLQWWSTRHYERI
jgi:sulfate transport system permease protein